MGPKPEVQEDAAWTSHMGRFSFLAKIQHGIQFGCFNNPYLDSLLGLQFLLVRKSGERCTGRLICFAQDGELRSTHSQEEAEFSELFKQFATEWMPFFRRGCWLCGCAIEASAHEKVEWMRVFSREEVEAWDLKF